MFAILFHAILQLATPPPAAAHHCHAGTAFDDDDDGDPRLESVDCGRTEVVVNVPFAVDSLKIYAEDNCPGQDSMIFAKTETGTTFCRVKDRAHTECELKDLPAGTVVKFQCLGEGEDGSGCKFQKITLT